jgi:hypothetical protein
LYPLRRAWPYPIESETFPMTAFEDDHFRILTFLLQMAQFESHD